MDLTYNMESSYNITTTLPFSTPRIAICYWGLQRSTKIVLPTHKQYIFDILHDANIDYDVYVHTWKVKENRVWNWELAQHLDPTDGVLYQPYKMRIDDQSEFLDNIIFSDYYYANSPPNGEWDPNLLRNHLCALESLKRVASMAIEGNLTRQYDYVMFIRPDAEFLNALPIAELLNLPVAGIAIPNNRHYSGYNDRFAFTRFNNMMPYSHRINGAKIYRNTIGRIVSEEYCKYTIDTNYATHIEVDLHFWLMRSDGSRM